MKQYRLNHKYCPFCNNEVKIKIHKYFYYPIRFMIVHKEPSKCILSQSIGFLKINELVDFWENAFKKKG